MADDGVILKRRTGHALAIARLFQTAMGRRKCVFPHTAQPRHRLHRAANVGGPGFAIWTRVSKAVGAFLIRMKPEDWTRGEITWRLDIIAPDRKITKQVVANFGTVVKASVRWWRCCWMERYG